MGRSSLVADLQALSSAVPLSGLDLAGPRDVHRIDLSDPLQGTGEVAACKARLSHCAHKQQPIRSPSCLICSLHGSAVASLLASKQLFEPLAPLVDS